jgi:hypothetical protein
MLSAAHARASGGIPVADYRDLTAAQGAQVMSIAGDTWKFYRVDIDPAQPRCNLPVAGGSSMPAGTASYTSAANIGVYLSAVVSGRDLGLISKPQARARIRRP